MAWNTAQLRLDILQMFASVSGRGWKMLELPSPDRGDDEELSIVERARRRRERLLASLRGRKRTAAR
jgi:hypothetical protein